MFGKVSWWLWTLVTLVSMLLALSTVAIWCRSYYVDQMVTYGRNPGGEVGLITCRGRIELFRQNDKDVATWTSSFHYATWPAFGDTKPQTWECVWLDAAGFVFCTGNPVTCQYDRYFRVSVPYWFIALAFLVIPTIWWFSYRRRRRIRTLPKNRCVRCGYDIRASRERCPECGTPVSAQPPEG